MIEQTKQAGGGGGTAFYVRNGLPFRSREDLESCDIETCWIKIIRRKADVIRDDFLRISITKKIDVV